MQVIHDDPEFNQLQMQD
jgi:nitrogen regulatory protein PII-like uncharacterized protein